MPLIAWKSSIEMPNYLAFTVAFHLLDSHVSRENLFEYEPNCCRDGQVVRGLRERQVFFFFFLKKGRGVTRFIQITTLCLKKVVGGSSPAVGPKGPDRRATRVTRCIESIGSCLSQIGPKS